MAKIEYIRAPEDAERELAEAGRAGTRFDRFQREARTFFRFIKLLKPYWDKVALIILCIVVGVPLGEISLFIFRYQIDEVVLNIEKSLPERLRLFFLILMFQLLLWLINHWMGFVRQLLGFYLNMKITLSLKKRFYDHLHRLSLSFLRTRPIGEHMFRVEADISGGGREGLMYMITQDIPELFRQIYTVIWAAILLAMVDWRLTVLILLYIIPYWSGAHYLYTRLKGTLRQNKIQGQRLNALLRDGIAGAKPIKGFGRIQYQVYKYTKQILAERRVWWKYSWLIVLTNHVILWMFQYGMTNAIWIYSAVRCLRGELSYGEFIVVLELSRRFEQPLEELIKLFQGIRLQLVPAERVLETLDVQPEIVDAPGAMTMPPLKGQVEFRHVDFEYIPGQPVLRDLNVTVHPGESVAFVGPSGAGKSTIMYLLLRLYEPARGQVLLDGIDIRHVRMRSYQEQIGVVLQETFLFGGSFADNIRYGKLTASHEEIVRAASLADIHDYIVSLPDGYQRDLGEGKRLSGGQQQRLGIARAAVRNPRILILDEATASLDSKVEAHIVGTIRRAMRGRTTLMISHRLVTVTHCDRIVVIDQGRVVESGKHEELLKNDGLYKMMWDEQTRGAMAS